ncbi:MAG: TetM/TetW/TetO/TetS family tetracycline resistance ribosomal protection protein [Lentimicrobium sp.]|nr:TetM/TetW/TetO/TetS family tetracycline resistance ribosomal protection protein [Lentimicrobium sp.]
MQHPIRNITIMAHADAGKTTITEQFLYFSGQTRQPGNVDKGTAQTDFLPVEKERGISVCSSHTSFLWNDSRINLIDTPGHVDFSADVERIMRITDGVILVISAVEGVQAHTETLWQALHERRIPVFFLINKIDRVGSDTAAVIQSIIKEFKVNPLLLQDVVQEGEAAVSVANCWNQDSKSVELTELIVASNKTMLNSYLEGIEPTFSELDEQLVRLVQSGIYYPLFYCSAKLGLGVEQLLNNIVRYFPVATGDAGMPLSALVYGIEHDKVMGKIALVRVFSGSISNREVIVNSTRDSEEKVTQVRRVFPGKFEDIGRVEAGDLAGICGLKAVCIGDLLGVNHKTIPAEVKLRTPLIIVQVQATDKKDYPALAAALLELSAEDPALNFEWLREDAELQVKIMGWIQMEVLEQILSDRFGIKATFLNPTVIYKETPSSIGEGFVRYWMPKPCWAILKFRLEPGLRGSGVVYKSLVSVNKIQQKYQHEVERTIAASLKQGVKGWEVTDLKITLIDGEDHTVHSRSGDFVIATPMGIMDGLVNTGTTLLEPMINFKIEAAEELMGVIVGDVTNMRGSFDSPEIRHGRFILTGILPLSTSIDYPVKLSSRSGGKARISTHFNGYRECSDELGVIRPYKGIHPLDTAKYILKARGAMQ